MIYTGMMPGEAQLLKVEHIDLENKLMFGMNLKTKVRKKTPVVLADFLIPIVEDLIANAQPSGYIWPHDQGGWYARYYAALQAAGCRKLRPYSCRHTTATALAVDAKIAPQVAKRVMRWSTAKMMDNYAHPNMEDALNAVNQIK
jgi:integrase